MIKKEGNQVFSYRTLKAASQGLYKEKGSKFLSFAFPVVHEEDIREKLALLRKEYFDARHHCYAWVLGADKNRHRASDDGEPSHSAGDPILGQIRAHRLTNVLVVVVRYFGGVKLGVGGLMSAYKTAAEDALKQASVVEQEVKESRVLQYGYEATPEAMKLVKDFELEIKEQKFDEHCCLVVEVKQRVKTELTDKVRLLRALGHSITLV
jgi:uncharacterized YigZ family protein